MDAVPARGGSRIGGSPYGGAAAGPVLRGGRRQLVRVKRSSGRKLRDLPELDLRTPSGRILPY